MKHISLVGASETGWFPIGPRSDNTMKDFDRCIAEIENGTSEEISLVNCNLGDDGACKVACSLESTCCIVKILRLGDNQIGERGAIALADSFSKNRSLTGLYMSGKILVKVGVYAFPAT